MGPTVVSLASTVTSVAAGSAVAVKDSNLVQSLTSGQVMPNDETSFVTNKPISKGMLQSEKYIAHNNCTIEKTLHTSVEFVNHDQLIESNESLNVSSDKTILDISPLFRETIPETEPHPTPPTSAIPATSIGIVNFSAALMMLL